jgi:CRP-like cAMP-binding protein
MSILGDLRYDVCCICNMNLTNDQMNLLSHNPLFKGLAPADIKKALFCLRAIPASYPADAFLFEEGDPAKRMGLLLSGRVDLLRYDEEGNVLLIESFAPGESFGEVYAIKENAAYGVNAKARETSNILWLEIAPLYNDLGCPFGKTLFRNLVSDLAEKDLRLKEKVTILSQKGLEAKVMMLLESYAPKEGGRFLLPFSREEMAAYLACERSALSRLLSEMAKEKKIVYSGNRFQIVHLKD